MRGVDRGWAQLRDVNGDAHQVHGRACAQLLLELGAVVGDRLVGDVEKVGDLRHRASRRQKAQDFEFAGAQIRNRVRARISAQKGDAPRHLGVQIAAAVRNRLDRIGKQRRIVILRDIAFGAGLDRARGDGWIVVHAEDDEPRLRLTLEDAAQKLEPGISRQIDVDDPDVGLVIEVGGETRRAVLRFDDLDLRLSLEESPAPRDNDRMVVDDQNPHRSKSPCRIAVRRASRAPKGECGPGRRFFASIDSSRRKINGERQKRRQTDVAFNLPAQPA